MGAASASWHLPSAPFAPAAMPTCMPWPRQSCRRITPGLCRRHPPAAGARPAAAPPAQGRHGRAEQGAEAHACRQQAAAPAGGGGLCARLGAGQGLLSNQVISRAQPQQAREPQWPLVLFPVRAPGHVHAHAIHTLGRTCPLWGHWNVAASGSIARFTDLQLGRFLPCLALPWLAVRVPLPGTSGPPLPAAPGLHPQPDLANLRGPFAAC